VERINGFRFEDKNDKNCDRLENIQGVQYLPVPCSLCSADADYEGDVLHVMVLFLLICMRAENTKSGTYLSEASIFNDKLCVVNLGYIIT
jgi:hypothetical protein